MKILISGGTGFVGSHLVAFLRNNGFEVRLLGRSARSSDVAWNPKTGEINLNEIEGFDAIIHLAGENIGKGFWTKAKKQRIYSSRVESTKHLAKAINSLQRPPKVFIVASAIGYYGDRGDEVLTESSSKGTGFLSDVCRDWEAASKQAKGVRVVNTRFGMILSPDGGALAKMLPIFRLGLGGRIGSGKQYISWISIDDLTKAMLHVIQREEIEGPINFVSPNPLTNKEFSQILAESLHKKLGPPLPGFLVRLFMGEKGESLLLCSTRVEPSLLLKTDYVFIHSDLNKALG